MSDNPPPPPGDLQFDKVEYASAGAGTPDQPPVSVCASCKQPLAGTYYEANGKLLCPRCKDAIQARLTGGSGFARFIRAVLFGLVAAVIGSLGYWAARAATGWEIGIVAIAMGWLVGAAVRRGAHMRGGVLYQLLAAGLTYLSISWSFLPMVMGDMDKYSSPDASEIEQVEASMRRDDAAMNRLKSSGMSSEDEGILDAVSKHNENVDPSDPALSTSQVLKFSTGTVVIPPKSSLLSRLTLTSDSKVLSGSQVVRPANTDELKPRHHLPSGLRKALITVIMLIISLLFPLLVAKSSPILALIYLFGLMQAWRMNRRPHIAITGPYQLGASEVSPMASAPPPLPPGA